MNFDTLLKDIYPHDLLASRSGNNNKNVNYLDTNISIHEGCCKVEVYHKVDEFNFPVVLYTFPSSNMPIRIGYNVFEAQLLRFARISSSLPSFVSKAKSLYDIFKDRGYNQVQLLRSCMNPFIKNRNMVYKFGLYSARQIPVEIGLV